MYGIAFETDEYYIFAQEYALAGDLFDIIPPQVRQQELKSLIIDGNNGGLYVPCKLVAALLKAFIIW